MARPTHTTDILFGTCKWAKLWIPSKWNKWSVELCLDNESLSKVLELKKQGIKNTIKKDQDGYWITLSRNAELTVEGKKRTNTPVLVIDKDGNPWNADTPIGNGSKLACKVQIAKYTVPIIKTQGIAIRLIGVKILDLVTFDKSSGYDKDEAEQLKGLDEAEDKPW